MSYFMWTGNLCAVTSARMGKCGQNKHVGREAFPSPASTMIEGYYRNQPGDAVKFFQYALSSAKETELWLWKAKQRELISLEQYKPLHEKLEDLVPQTIKFINRARQKLTRP